MKTILIRENKRMFDKTKATLIAGCLMIGVTSITNIALYSATLINPANYSQKYNLQTEYLSSSQTVEKTLKDHSTEKISLSNEQIKKVKKINDGSGQINFYAVISDGARNINVEIPDNIYKYITNNKILKENVTITINQAKPKGIINGDYIVSNVDHKL